MKEISFTIYGTPIGKGRPKFSKVGNFVRTYTDNKTMSYENKVISAFKEQQKNTDFEMLKPNERVIASIVAYYQMPKSCYVYHKKTNSLDLTKKGEKMVSGKTRPLLKPDLDNIAKVCLDALNGVAYYDDSQVIRLVVEKYYSEEPKVEIYLKGEENE